MCTCIPYNKIKKLQENTHSGSFNAVKKHTNQASPFNCTTVLLCLYIKIQSLITQNAYYIFHMTPPSPHPPFHSLHRVKGDAEMNQCSAVNEPIVRRSLASLTAQLRRCPVNEAKGCRKRIVHPVLSVPPKSAVYNDAIKHTNCSSHAQGDQSWCYL